MAHSDALSEVRQLLKIYLNDNFKWLLLGSGVVRPGPGRGAEEVWCEGEDGSS